MDFYDLDLNDQVLDALDDMNFTECTPIQEHAIPVILEGRDLIGVAQTGTGKLIYGFLVGLMAMLIRIYNPAYPEGMMLAILLMNTFAPLIDYLVVGRNMARRRKRLVLASKKA